MSTKRKVIKVSECKECPNTITTVSKVTCKLTNKLLFSNKKGWNYSGIPDFCVLEDEK